MADQFITLIQQRDPNLAQLDQYQIRQLILNNLVNLETQKQQRGVGPTAPADIDAFGPLIAHVIRQQEIREGISNFLEVSEAFPPADTTKEIIVYHLKRRAPATFSQDQPFTGVKNYKPLYRESYPDPDNPGYVIVVMGVLFDNLMEVACWGKTNQEVDRRALWLESVLLANTWMFRHSGFNQVLYTGRGEDQDFQINNLLLRGRTLTYYLRTEKLITVSEKTIDEILFSTSLDLDEPL